MRFVKKQSFELKRFSITNVLEMIQTIQISRGIVSFMLLRHEKRRTLSCNGTFRISSYLVVYFHVGNLTINLRAYETAASKIELTVFYAITIFFCCVCTIYHSCSNSLKYTLFLCTTKQKYITM